MTRGSGAVTGIVCLGPVAGLEVDTGPVWELWSLCGVRAVAMIDHPAGEECQWDWLELRDTPWGSRVFVLVGVLSHSGRFRACLSSSQDQAYLVEGIDEVLRRS